MTRRLILVTGTSTDVGKTVATAALAASSAAGPRSVLVVKPVQTGIGDGSRGDADEVHRLAGCEVVTFYELDEPLAPDTAARRAGVTLPTVAEHADRILALAGDHDEIIVEGAGGLLVRLDTDGGTLLDLATHLAHTLPDGIGLDVVVVVGAGLGTLNHSELTVRALRARGIEPHGLIVGSWPAEPGLAESCNLEDLPTVTGLPILAVLPAGAGRLEPSDFRTQSKGWFKNHR